MLKNYSTEQLLQELTRRTAVAAQPTKPASTFREQTHTLIVTGVKDKLSKEARAELLGYRSAKSNREVIDVVDDRAHKCIRIITRNASHGQNFQDDLAWLVGKVTNNPKLVYWADREGRTRVRGFLHKLNISFSWVVKG